MIDHVSPRHSSRCGRSPPPPASAPAPALPAPPALLLLLLLRCSCCSCLRLPLLLPLLLLLLRFFIIINSAAALSLSSSPAVTSALCLLCKPGSFGLPQLALHVVCIGLPSDSSFPIVGFSSLWLFQIVQSPRSTVVLVTPVDCKCRLRSCRVHSEARN